MLADVLLSCDTCCGPGTRDGKSGTARLPSLDGSARAIPSGVRLIEARPPRAGRRTPWTRASVVSAPVGCARPGTLGHSASPVASTNTFTRHRLAPRFVLHYDSADVGSLVAPLMPIALLMCVWKRTCTPASGTAHRAPPSGSSPASNSIPRLRRVSPARWGRNRAHASAR